MGPFGGAKGGGGGGVECQKLLVIIIRPTGLLFFSASLIALAVGIMEFKKWVLTGNGEIEF